MPTRTLFLSIIALVFASSASAKDFCVKFTQDKPDFVGLRIWQVSEKKAEALHRSDPDSKRLHPRVFLPKIGTIIYEPEAQEFSTEGRYCFERSRVTKSRFAIEIYNGRFTAVLSPDELTAMVADGLAETPKGMNLFKVTALGTLAK